MNSKSRVVITLLVAVLALPIAAFAAKGDKKKADALPSFTSVDKNGDKAVTEDEFIAANKDKLGETGAKSRFAMLDKDHDGKLTQEEYEADAPKKKGKKKNAN